MNFNRKITNKSVLFKKWNNTPWAIFKTLGKTIKIVSLTLSYFILSQFTVNAQNRDTVNIHEINVQSSRTPMVYNESARVILIIEKNEIEKMPVHSVQDLLENINNVDVRQRGVNGVQADISIRGGNFDQTLILINGVKINDPQTGHHNLNIPIDINNVERIEILEGPGNRVFGINSYSGAINIITNTKKQNTLNLTSYAGLNNTYVGNINASLNYKSWHNYLSLTAKTSDGYLQNDSINNTDYKIYNLFYQSNIKLKKFNFNFQTGHTLKQFGANSFYSPKFPWQYEQTLTNFASYRITAGRKIKLTQSTYIRRNQDRFELFREDKFMRKNDFFVNNTDTAKFYPGIYESWNYYKGHNYHVTYTAGADLKINFSTIAGKTAVGGEFQSASIYSNVLGEDIDTPIDVPFEDYGEFTKSKTRNEFSIFAEHVLTIDKMQLSGGLSAVYMKKYDLIYNGGADLSYKILPHIKMFGSINYSSRLPTFTDLYYQGPTNEGNPDLFPENALTYEFGVKFSNRHILSHVAIFSREGTNTIDWVRLSETEKWKPRNLTKLTTAGIEYYLKIMFEKYFFINNITLFYNFIDAKKESDNYISMYVMDYLKHKFLLSINHKIIKNLDAYWQIKFEDRNGTYTSYDLSEQKFTGEKEYLPFVTASMKLQYSKSFYNIFFEISNITNTEYHELGNIKMPGREFKIGFSLNFK